MSNRPNTPGQLRNMVVVHSSFAEQFAAVEQQRDVAWRELNEIREAVTANPEESTADEVRRVVAQRNELLASLKKIAAESMNEGGCYYSNRINIKRAKDAIAKATGEKL